MITNLYTPQAVLVRAAGLFKEVRFQTILQAIMTLIIGIPLTITFGINGMLFASCISNLLRVILMVRLVAHQKFGIPLSTTINRIFISIISIILITFPFYLQNNYSMIPIINIDATTYYNWVIIAIGVFLYSLIIVLILNLVFQRGTTIRFITRILNTVSRKVY